MKYKLVVSDLDGTLLNSSSKISNYSIEQINNFHNKGVMFSIASGRPLGMQDYECWNLDFEPELRIGLNGGECFDSIENKKYLYYQLSISTLKEIIEMMNGINMHESIFVHSEGNIITNKMDKRFEHHSYRTIKQIHVTSDINELYQKPNSVILFRFKDKQDAIKCLEKVNKKTSNEYKAFISSPTLIEFVDKRLSKVTALKDFCIRHNIKMKEVIACGDSLNDNDLLMKSGVGICMCNGNEITKKYANVITQDNNDCDGAIKEVIKII